MACENYMKLKFHCAPMKVFWSTAICTYLYIVCGSFHAMRAAGEYLEWRGYDLHILKYLQPGPFRKVY